MQEMKNQISIMGLCKRDKMLKQLLFYGGEENELQLLLKGFWIFKCLFFFASN